MEKSVLIQNGDSVIMELVVITNHHTCQYAIKREAGNGYVLQIISAESFQAIINDAREHGCDVFDFTDF